MVKHGSGDTILDVIAVVGEAGFFFDDQAAIKAGARREGFIYEGAPRTPGYTGIRQPASSVSVMLVMDDGYVAHGDCASVQYSGVGGREPILDADVLVNSLARDVAPRLRGTVVGRFTDYRSLLAEWQLTLAGFGAAASYGVSQALLDARAHSQCCTMAEIVSDEWGLAPATEPVPVLAQCGEDRYANVDKMILRRVDSLPHGLINTIDLIGEDGSALVEYVRWVSQRAQTLRTSQHYMPVLHFDLYGTLGLALGDDLEAVASVLLEVEQAAQPFRVRVEQPVHASDRDAQIAVFVELRERLRQKDSAVELVADEWANTLEDIRAFNAVGAAHVVQIKAPDLGPIHDTVEAIADCRHHGVLAHLGGSCCETDRSAQVCVHVAVGAGAGQLLAKPGMGVDEGLTIVRNEMARTFALVRIRRLASSGRTEALEIRECTHDQFC